MFLFLPRERRITKNKNCLWWKHCCIN